MASKFRVLDAARSVVDDINQLLDSSECKLFYVEQLREAAGSIAANIQEAYGRRKGPERNQFFRFARGSTREADERIRANFAANRLPSKRYWQIHHRLSVIVKMLNSLMNA